MAENIFNMIILFRKQITRIGIDRNRGRFGKVSCARGIFEMQVGYKDFYGDTRNYWQG